MTPAVDLLGFLTLGLLGGFGHCVGMCSPFVMLVSRRFVAPGASRGATMGAQAWYTAGRLATYAVLGAVAGALGGVVQLAGSLVGVQRAAEGLAGLVLVLYGLGSLLGSLPGRAGAGGALFARVVGLLKRRVPGHPFALGLVLGLLPCGLLWSAVIAATALGGAGQGALALALFGLGTAPSLLGLSLADQLLVRHRAWINRVGQAFVLAMGAWFLVGALR